jgi:hypothetical protein
VSPGKPLPPAAWEVIAASLLILGRAWIYPISGLWRDWFTILCAFWIFTAVASKTKAWPYVTGAVMAGLLVLYGSGQLPQALGAFR